MLWPFLCVGRMEACKSAAHTVLISGVVATCVAITT